LPVALALPLDDSILLPGGRELLTLRDAADYITKLPKAEQDLRSKSRALADGARHRRFNTGR
jgi:hypothetical protein